MAPIIETSKERIYLSKRVFEFIQNEGESIWSNRRYAMDKIDCEFSNYNHIIVKAIYDSYGRDIKFLRKPHFEESVFCKEMQAQGATQENLYAVYEKLNDFSQKDYSEETIINILSIHKRLAIAEITEKLTFVFSSDYNIDERINYILSMIKIYPYNPYILQELAILFDEKGKLDLALQYIVNAITINFEDKMLWQSYNVISNKILNSPNN